MLDVRHGLHTAETVNGRGGSRLVLQRRDQSELCQPDHARRAIRSETLTVSDQRGQAVPGALIESYYSRNLPLNWEPETWKEFSWLSGVSQSFQGKGSEAEAHLSIKQVQANPVLHDIVIIGRVPVTVRPRDRNES